MTSTTRNVVLCAFVMAMLAAPLALAAGEGDPLDAGTRNPSADQSTALTRETEIIANSGTYGTRQSNKSNNGGGAIYGCRSRAGGTPATQEPCIRANNLADGRAFELVTGGTVAGAISTRGGPDTRPFVTNATGVATGLNADRVDGLEGEQLRARYAQVASNGTAGVSHGLVAKGVSRQNDGDYDVVFAGDLGTCALSATIVGAGGGEISVVPAVAANKQSTRVDVRTFTSAGSPSDRGFHLTASC